MPELKKSYHLSSSGLLGTTKLFKKVGWLPIGETAQTIHVAIWCRYMFSTTRTHVFASATHNKQTRWSNKWSMNECSPQRKCHRRHLQNLAVRIKVACSMSWFDCAIPNVQYVSNVPMNTTRKRHHTPCIANFINYSGPSKFRIHVNLSFDAVLFFCECHWVSEILSLPRPGLVRLRAL